MSPQYFLVIPAQAGIQPRVAVSSAIAGKAAGFPPARE
jgi:hypothetical protein